MGRKAKRYPGTYEELAQLIHYDPATGHMETLGPYTSTGTQMKDGYLHIPVADGIEALERGHRQVAYYRADHVAWMLVTGIWPDGWIEHINGLRADNTMENLVHINADHERWWYGTQAPGEEPKLVMVENVTMRVMNGDEAVLRPVVIEEHRTAKMRPVDVSDPHEEDYEYPRGEFGVDWT